MSQLKTNERSSEQFVISAVSRNTFTEPTQLVNRDLSKRRKFNIPPGPGETTAVETAQIDALNPLRQDLNVAPAQNKAVPVGPVQATVQNPTSRRPSIATEPEQRTKLKWNQPVTISPRKTNPKLDLTQRTANFPVPQNCKEFHLGAADRIKTSPRKAVSQRQTCLPCRQRHRACDRAQPSCGQCAKRSQHDACQYTRSTANNNQILASHPEDPQVKTKQSKAPASPSRSRPQTAARPGDFRSLRTPYAERDIDPGRSGSKIPVPSTAEITLTKKSTRRVIPDITDYDTYMKWKANGDGL